MPSLSNGHGRSRRESADLDSLSSDEERQAFRRFMNEGDDEDSVEGEAVHVL